MTTNSTTRERPASHAQTRMWFGHQIDPASPADNLPAVTTGLAPHSVACLFQAVNETARRHEALRATFGGRDGHIVQVVSPDVRVRPLVVDLSGLPPSRVDIEVQRLSRDNARHGFNLETGPLWRLALIEGPSWRTDFLTMHHIVSDGRALDVLRQEARALARQFAGGGPGTVPRPAAQYHDFVEWQRAWVDSEEGRAHLDYWLRTLAPPRAAIELPVDRPKPARTLRGARLLRRLRPGMGEALKRYAASENATLFMVTLTALKALLAQYSGQTDIIVGSLVDTRRHRTFAEMVGFAVNTIALRTALGGDPTFTELLRRVRRTCLDAYTHQQVPFEMIVDRLNPARVWGRTPLIDVCLVVHHESAHRRRARISRDSQGERRVAKFDLSLEVLDSGSEVDLGWIYATDLFDHATIEQLAIHYEALLGRALASPERSIREIQLAPTAVSTPRARAAAAARVSAGAEGIIEAIERHARERGDAVALMDGAQQITYDGLNQASNRLARHLRRLGAGPEITVGVLLERGASCGVALLGILKAGAAYVPLSSDLPPERLAWMFEDARVAVIVTDRATRDRLPPAAIQRRPVVTLDEDWPIIEQEAAINPRAARLDESLAYLIYTSGSTGEPKGVAVTYAAISEHTRHVVRAFGERSGDRVLQFASLGFDVSIEQMLAPWRCGASVWVRDRTYGTSEIASQVREANITIVNLPTAYFAQWAADEAAHSVLRESSLRLMIAGGERLHRGTAITWLAAVPKCRLLNAYGPTEGVITATMMPVVPEHEGEIPIGTALDGRTVCVRDASGAVALPRVIGEICLGGLLAREYWRRPSKTAEAFVPNDLAPAAGERSYQTGDLGRQRPDGTFEYVGRRDRQIKLRGYRIELGAIETAVEQHENVRQCVALLQPGAHGASSLTVYVVSQPHRRMDEQALRQHLAARLFEYEQPQAFVEVEEIPLTPNGKVDHAALPLRALDRPDRAYRPPGTDAERVLAAIWRDVLKVDRIGLDDDFFDLGGDSILSLQVVARAARQGLRITPQHVFDCPTVAALAAVATTRSTPSAGASVSGTVALTPIQHWFFERKLQTPAHWNMSVLLRIPSMPPSAVQAALQAVFVHHDATRLQFRREPDGSWRQARGAESPPAAVIHDLRASGPDWTSALAAESQRVQQSLDLGTRTIAAALFRLPPGADDRLLIVAHHLVVDAVSWRVLLEDIATACAQIAAGERVQLPPKTASWLAWADGLVSHASSRATVDETEYWRRVAAAAAAVLFPLETPGGANPEASTEKVTRRLSDAATHTLLHEATAWHRATVIELLLAGLASALRRWTGHDRVALTLEGHGREPLWDVDVSRTAGWFTSLYPVVLDVAADPVAVVAAVKEQWRAIPRHGIGYGLLRYLSPDIQVRKMLADCPLPPICVNYLGQFGRAESNGADAPRVSLAPESAGHTRASSDPRPFLLDVTMSVTGGRLSVSWSYSREAYDGDRIARAADDHLAALQSIVDGRGAAARTPSIRDFPLANLDQSQLETLLGQMPVLKQGGQ